MRFRFNEQLTGLVILKKYVGRVLTYYAAVRPQLRNPKHSNYDHCLFELITDRPVTPALWNNHTNFGLLLFSFSKRTDEHADGQDP